MNRPILSDTSIAYIEDFFAKLPAADCAAGDQWFSYIAVRHKGELVLLAGTLRFNPGKNRPTIRQIDSELVSAGEIEISSFGFTPRLLVEQAIEGRIELPGMSLAFPAEDNSSVSVFPRPNINFGTPDGRVENVLQVAGIQRGQVVDYSAIDLDLKAHGGFHGSLNQLLSIYRILPNFGAIGLWLLAAPIVEFGSSVRVPEGEDFELSLLLRPGFDEKLVSVGLTFINEREAKLPLTFLTSEIEWANEDGVVSGTLSLRDLGSEAVECIAIYDKKVQHTKIFDLAFTPEGLLDSDLSSTKKNQQTGDRSSASAMTPPRKANHKAKPEALSRVTAKTTKHLFALSGNRCAYPDCTKSLVSNGVTIGEICHIKAARPNGPRYDPLQSDADRHGSSNLILLCGNHHTEVDSDEGKFTVETLREMKRTHEETATKLDHEDVEKGAEALFGSHLSYSQSGGISTNTVNTTNIYVAPQSPIPALAHSDEIRAFFAPELSRVLAHQVWVLDRLIVFHVATSVGRATPGDKLTDFCPKAPRLYPTAPEFQGLPPSDKLFLAEFYDATAAIDETIVEWSRSAVKLEFNHYNLLMQNVKHTVELGMAAAGRFCPERLFSPTIPVMGTVIERSAASVSRAGEAMEAHIKRRRGREPSLDKSRARTTGKR